MGALRAAEHGLSVLVLEKAAVCGGTTALSGAGLWAPANMHVLAAGQADALDLARPTSTHTVGDRTPRGAAGRYLEAAAETIDWLETPGRPLLLHDRLPRLPPRAARRAPHRTGRHPEGDAPRRTSRSSSTRSAQAAAGRRRPADRRPVPRARTGAGSRSSPCCSGPSPRRASRSGRRAPFTDLLVEDGRVVGVTADHDGQRVTIGARAGCVLRVAVGSTTTPRCASSSATSPSSTTAGPSASRATPATASRPAWRSVRPPT